MQYDQNLLLKAAMRFQDRARLIVLWCAAKYIAIAFPLAFAGAALGARFFPEQITLPPLTIAIAIGVLALIAGVVIGLERAFYLRVEAQKLIALVQIERNTKRADAANA